MSSEIFDRRMFFVLKSYSQEKRIIVKLKLVTHKYAGRNTEKTSLDNG